MTRNTVWMLAAAMATSAGCLTTGGGFGDDDLQGDADADVDADTDADVDADSDSDTGSDTTPVCPEAPDWGSGDGGGWRQGDIVTNLSLPGSGPDDTWSMEDFWCMANDGREDPPTVLIMNIHSST